MIAHAVENEPSMTDRPPSPRLTRQSRVAEAMMLEERAFSVKKRFLAMYNKAHAGHIGSSLSCAELLTLLKFGWMRDDDSFVLSKGHAAAALYAILAEAGVLSPDQIDTFYGEGTLLPALTPANVFKQIPFATGSLGHGLSLCAGLALGALFAREHRRTFCLTSDGELNEGSVWEAALFIAHRKLNRLVWLIDRNRIQGIGRTEEVMALDPLDAKLRAFGFHVVMADGHDFASLLATRDECEQVLLQAQQPIVIIANTIKGHGLSCMQDTVDSHYLPLEDAQYAQAIHELGEAHALALTRYRDAG
jgi:transketolase